MDERVNVHGVTRRALLRRGAVAGVGVSSAGFLLAACGGSSGGGGSPSGGGGKGKVTWISPRGTLAVMDDYPLWVAVDQGYFKSLGIDAKLVAGPTDATASTKFVAQHKADVGYPSPGVLASSIDAGLPVIMAFDLVMGQVFDFALPANSPITSPKQLEGKTIALGAPGFDVIVDPILVEVGVDPKSVHYLTAGQQAGQVIASGKADAGLAWEGLRAQWLGQGLKLKFLIGEKFSKGPSNGYAVRKEDLDDKHQRDVLTRFLRGTAMGLAFGKANPQAAAQITYERFPDLQHSLKPELAFSSMLELAGLYGAGERMGKGWGYSDLAAWQSYLDVLKKLGQIKQPLKASEVATNELADAANQNLDVDRVNKDAKAFKLNSAFAKLKVPSDVQL